MNLADTQAADPGPAIAVRNLRKTFAGREALRGLDLTVARGELLGLIGPNGAGKSTLLRSLLGLCPIDQGAVAVLGLDPRLSALAIRRRASYLPGESGVYTQLTGRQFLDFALGFYPRHQAALQAELLERFALPLQQRVRTYSAGMKQKLALCAALVPDVELYLLDEPDRALDASVRLHLRAVLRQLRAAGKTIVLSSHHLGEVEALADRLEFVLAGALVPQARLQAARACLRSRPRVRLAPGAVLPDGARVLQHEADGTLLVETQGEPMQWLRQSPPGAIDSVELGIPRLEDLYALLLAEPPGGGS